jgi:hypothetical protein
MGFRHGRPTRAALAIAAVAAWAAPPPAAAQTWNGAGTDWNTAANWTPAGVPNSSSATPQFAGAGLGTVNISSGVQVFGLSFTNATGNYTLTSNAGQFLRVTKVVVVPGATGGTRTINLAGTLLYPGVLQISNNSGNSSSPTFVIGPTTTIDTLGINSVISYSGHGITQISGSFAASGKKELDNVGPGKLIFSGNGTNIDRSLQVLGGTLELNYATNTASKTCGFLNLGRGVLSLVANASTPVNQTLTQIQFDGHGQTDVVATSAGGGSLTVAAGPISRTTVGGTFDASTGAGSPIFALTTTTGNTNNLLGGGPAFATVNGGGTWATASGGTVAGLSAGGYGTNTFTTNTNVDVTASATPAPFTANSLRLSGANLALTLTGTNTLQSGGILVAQLSSNGTIAGGTLTAPGGGELLVHQYANSLTINSALVSTAGLTVSGAATGTVILGGSNTGLTGPISSAPRRRSP